MSICIFSLSILHCESVEDKVGPNNYEHILSEPQRENGSGFRTVSNISKDMMEMIYSPVKCTHGITKSTISFKKIILLLLLFTDLLSYYD
jgi:hypothetical protein